MAEIEPPTSPGTQETGSELASSTPGSPRVEHVAPDDDETTASHEDDHAVDADHHVAEMNENEKPAIPAPAKPTTIPKSPVKSVAGKTGVPASPVKKVLSAGTFGTGATKTNTSALKATPASPIKKTTSMSAAATAKPSVPASRGSVAPPARRASMAPPKTAASAALTKATTGVAKAAPATSGTSAARASATSPLGSAAQAKVSGITANRPRASMSAEAMARTASGRQSSASAKPPTPSAAKAPTPTLRAPAPSRGGASGVPKPTRSATISSMKEVKASGTVSPELQQKLKEAQETLAAKEASLETLTADCARLESSLKDVQTLAGESKAQVEALQKAKDAAESEATMLKERLENIQGDDAASAAQLEAVRKELETAKSMMAEQSDLVKSLQAQIGTLEEQVAAAKANLFALRATNEASSTEAATSANIDRAALLKAQDDFVKIEKEMEGLKGAHEAALSDLAAQLKASEEKATKADALEVEVAQLISSREENAQKLSELEVEILELKESKEVAEDEHAKILARVNALEAELAKSKAEVQHTIESAEAKEKALIQQKEEVDASHAHELEKLAAQQSSLESQLQSLRTELEEAQGLYEQSKKDNLDAADKHANELKDAALVYAGKEEGYLAEIKRIQADLDSQESKYNAKVAEVKAAHEGLLHEAFERAKAEAGDAHGQDLSSLRAASDATMEQITASHRATIEALTAEHDDKIANTTREFEKQVNSLTLELKATREDLLKTKAALDTARSEAESARGQLSDALNRDAAAPSIPQEIMDEIERLTKEISRKQDDLDAATEALELTKASLSEMSSNHHQELEEAARSRANEVAKIEAEHDKELNQLVEQKTELQIRLSDMETELNTAKATAAAVQSSAVPKTNGSTATQSNDENMQRLHEAHNLKVQDLTTEHSRREKTLLAQIEELEGKYKASQADAEHVKLELHYLQQDNDESQETISRLQAELEEIKSKA